MKSLSQLPLKIDGMGAYTPDKVLTNHDLEDMVETSDKWITQRTGIKERCIASSGQATSDMAINAAKQALARSALRADEIEAIIVCTCTPDYLFPATSCIVQNAIGATNAFCYDLEAACSGFLFGFAQGAALVSAGMAENALVIGAETLSKFTDWEDRRSCILFGDGAGAAIIQKGNPGDERGIVFCEMGSDGSRPEILMIPAGGSRNPSNHKTVDNKSHYMKLEGREVFKWAVGKLGELVGRIPEETGISLDEIKLIIPHQSNERIIRSVCQRANIPVEKAYMNIDRVGNTSAASIPMALEEAAQKKLLTRGDLVLLLSFGGGVTWGSMLLRY